MSRPEEVRRHFPRYIGGYRMPDPFARDDDLVRLRFDDLLNMDKYQLWREEKQLESALAAVEPWQWCYTLLDAQWPAEKWLRLRFRAVCTEIERRSLDTRGD